MLAGRKAPKALIFLIIFAAIGLYVIFRSFAASATCDFTYAPSQASTIQSTVSSSANSGKTVCVSAGAFASSLTLSGTHADDITIQPDPISDPNGLGKVTIPGINIGNNASHIVVRGFYSTRGINFGAGSSYITIDHNDVANPSGFGISIATNLTTDPDGHDLTISGNRIHDTSHTSEGDAIRLQGWYNVKVLNNEIFNVYEGAACKSGSTDLCHTDCLQSYQNNKNGTAHDLVYDHNYLHDNNCQEFFLKDGDVTPNVTFTNNLFLRNNNPAGLGPWTGFWIAENTVTMIVRNNTILDGNVSAITSTGSTPSPTLAFDHNIINRINYNDTTHRSYAITNDYNVYTDNTQYNWAPKAAHEIYGTSGITYQCGSLCGNGTVAGDDYRLTSQPYSGNTIGVDWKPADYTYGPEDVSGGSDTTPPVTTINTSASGTPSTSTTSTSATFTFTANETSTFQCKLDSGSYASCTSPKAYTGLATGSHTFSVKATDTAGNVETTAKTYIWTITASTTNPADINNDGTVNLTDLSILLSNYGKTTTTGDINNDGTVNLTDLSILLSNYGQTSP